VLVRVSGVGKGVGCRLGCRCRIGCLVKVRVLGVS
jgi:hypothetical protein